MERVLIKDALLSNVPLEQIRIAGWIRTRRDAKGFSFLELNDGSCLSNIQCIVDEGTTAHKALLSANTGAGLILSGSLVPSPGKGQRWEIRVRDLELLGVADPETYPLQKKRHSDEFLRSIAHLRVRTNKYGAAMRVRSEAAFAIHQWLREHSFYYVHTPILTGSDCEGAGEMFRVSTDGGQNSSSDDSFFGKTCHLTVSGQLEAEALALALGRVYTFGPTFRAENSNTARHAAEFWMVEPEMAFADLRDDMHLAEDLLKGVMRSLLERSSDDLALFDRFVQPNLLKKLEDWSGSRSFVHLPYGECIEILKNCSVKFEHPVSYGIDLQTEHERFLAEVYCSFPVIITDYPRAIKPFYMRDNDDGLTVAAMDILVPGIGEIVGGSQREERLGRLEAKMDEMGMMPERYWWYSDLRRFGSVPHAGFGLGFERLLMLLTGIANIRDVLPFPRTPGNLDF
ncbi:MAG: asparagine--tRNA ligase [Desulfovibrio sp.]|nr:asparagine--tRNA ligase [Desulfovibrio sp.]